MTRPEMTGKRSLVFSAWHRKKLRGSNTGLAVFNQDWVFWDWKSEPKKLMLIEEKTHRGKLEPYHWIFIKDLMNPALEEFCKKKHVDYKGKEFSIDYRGYHLIVFENEGPEDGKIFWHQDCERSGEEISEEELINRLNLEDERRLKNEKEN